MSHGILALFCLLLLAGCGIGQEEAALQATMAPAGATAPDLLPTPTLLPELAQITRPPPTPVITPTATPTPTPTATPTATPQPAERIEIGQARLQQENFDAAAQQFQASLSAPGALDREQQEEAIWGLSLAYLREGRYAEAADALQRYLALVDPAGETAGPAPLADTAPTHTPAYFHLAEAQAGAGNCEAALAAYDVYLQANPDMAAYVQPRIAACHLQLGDPAAALTAYEAAVAADAHRLTLIENHEQAADLYSSEGDYEAAIAHYDAVHDLAVTENTRGEMTYRAGTAYLLAGDEAEGYARYLRGVENYPRAHETYLGLLALVEAGRPVDAYQRGVVDYHAGAYTPAVDAFTAYLEANPETYEADVHLYLAWSYEGLGDLQAALAQLDAYAASGGEAKPHAAEAGVERAKLLARADRIDDAIAAYLEVVAAHPDSEQAAFAAWWAAVLSQLQGYRTEAIDRFRHFVEAYPDHEDVPEALFRAGLLAWQSGDEETAVALWKSLGQDYPQAEFGPAGLVWLMNVAPDVNRYVVTATQTTGTGYYALRARELADGVLPFQSPPQLDLVANEAEEEAEAEAWLRDQFNLDPAAVTSHLAPSLTQDVRLVRGGKLWQLGLYEEARRELEAVRTAYSRDALASYQLALYFRDLGLYRSSILAADTVLALAGRSALTAPRLIGRLAYPIYYADLVLPLAEQYGYDPLLQFSLVRQESLFESFIASYVGAQGLSQVMPATGEHIAQRLDWPDYANEDLYRPYVGLAFGAYYLDEQLQRFDGNVYAALSAYNAGPGNAARWFELAPDNPDLYLETVDFAETRLYIKRIYTGYVMYRHLYGVEE